MFATKKVLNLFLAISMLLGSVAGVSAKYTAIAIGNDTIAGQETTIKAKNFSPDEMVNFTVEKPDGLSISMSSQANANGEATAELYDYHTKRAGTYAVMAFSSDRSIKTVKTTFTVFPADLDPSNSVAEVTRSIVKADGVDSADIIVQLKDSFGNSLDGRSVKIISSRKTDSISPAVAISDSNGQAVFTVKSETAGLANFLVMDLAEDLVFDERANLSFVGEDDYLADAGGDLIMTAHAQDAGPLAGFEILDLPSTIKPNENVSFKVRAIDAEGVTVQDYTGTVRFSAEGENSSGVTLPANYKFLAEDLGQHQFNLGLSFAQAGTYKIVVNDLADKFKKGEKTVVVGATSGGTSQSGGIKPTISAPVAGTYSQAEQTISGSAKSSSTVKIYDNGQELGSTPVGPTGKFTYQSPALSDGEHSIYVSNIDSISFEVIGTSDPVVINIDTTPPALEDLVLEPETGIKAGSVIDVKVFSEENLSQAAVIFNFDIIQLNASIDDPSIYVGTIQAPADAGVYKLSVLLVDELQNEQTYEDQASITVDPNGGTIETVGDENPPVDQPPVEVTPPAENGGEVSPAAGAPSQVTGLIAYGSDKRVTLVWDAATDDKLVKNYKIYYGGDVKELNQTAVTKDASTTWYIPNLENGKEYFFAITAMDDEGNESTLRSEIVSGIPFMLEINNALTEAPNKPLDDGLKPAAYSGPFPTNTTKTGPELLLVVGASAVLGTVWQNRKRRK